MELNVFDMMVESSYINIDKLKKKHIDFKLLMYKMSLEKHSNKINA